MQKQMRPGQFPESEILNKEDRLYRGWGSVEIRDTDGELIPIDEIKRIMPVLVDRGGDIIDSHSNRKVGKLINYEFKTHPETGSEGVMITAKNFKHYKFDDEIWDKITKGEYKGFSFGGLFQGRVSQIVDMEPTEVLNNIMGLEFSVVEEPANPPSLFTEVNYLAKFQKSKNKEKVMKEIKTEDLKAMGEDIRKELIDRNIYKDDKTKDTMTEKEVKKKKLQELEKEAEKLRKELEGDNSGEDSDNGSDNDSDEGSDESDNGNDSDNESEVEKSLNKFSKDVMAKLDEMQKQIDALKAKKETDEEDEDEKKKEEDEEEDEDKNKKLKKSKRQSVPSKEPTKQVKKSTTPLLDKLRA